MLGGNCRGAEKARRLRAYLHSDDVELWAYGDSAGDTELLAMADHPVRVGARLSDELAGDADRLTVHRAGTAAVERRGSPNV